MFTDPPVAALRRVGNASCDGPNDFLCPSGRCIRKANVCDSQCDCGWDPALPGSQWNISTCADEKDCGQFYEEIKATESSNVAGVRVCRPGKTLSCTVPTAVLHEELEEEFATEEEREAAEVEIQMELELAESVAISDRERCISAEYICDQVNDCQNGNYFSDEFRCRE
ncbi:hypothetical protein J437_LFUL001966 [Ladona fulva]|uniref:Uncharacterized protein n=1 Tax=Ladona fulva TaxID=123851 RepID=A0A8K0JVK9_LADFU|nr:hypothetical protein J437_LFUL001966 [Ladona fulva]